MAKKNPFFNNKRKPINRRKSDAEKFLIGTTGVIAGTVLTVEAARALGRL